MQPSPCDGFYPLAHVCQADEPALLLGRQAVGSNVIGAAAVIRGVRNTTDFEYERTMAATNRRLYPAVVTVMLFTPPDVADISSSTVREVLGFGRSVAEFLPRGVELKNYL